MYAIFFSEPVSWPDLRWLRFLLDGLLSGRRTRFCFERFLFSVWTFFRGNAGKTCMSYFGTVFERCGCVCEKRFQRFRFCFHCRKFQVVLMLRIASFGSVPGPSSFSISISRFVGKANKTTLAHEAQPFSAT